MPSSYDSWGIEVGGNAIKAIRLQRSGDAINVAEYDVIPLKRVLSTPDINADEMIRLGLDQFMARHAIGRATVVASVPGHMAFARFAKLPPVEPKKVPDIVKFEAVQQIPFPIEQVEWDYQTFQHADSPDVEAGIFAITKERVLTWLSHFHAVNLPVHALSLSPVAVYNALSYDRKFGPDTPGTILVDIGTQATELIIYESGRIWLRTIPIGGHQFTESLVRSFKLSYTKAEKLKKEAATSKYARQIFQAMRPVFVDLVGEIQKSLGYYHQMNRDAELKQLIGTGSTFRLPGLQKFIKQQLQLDVSRLDTFRRIEPEGRNAAAFAENILTMPPAYGLALQGLGLEQISCNVLPAGMVRQQIWRAKQPWTLAATLIIVASAALGYARLLWDRQAYDAQADVRQQIQSILAKAQQAKTRWDEIKRSDPRPKIENLRRIIDYRNVWPAIAADIDQATLATRPQPELLRDDPKIIMSVDRSQRRRIYVESINREYRFGDESTDSHAIWGSHGEEDQIVRSDRGDVPEHGTAADATIESTARTAKPTFVITVIGTTPNDNASEFLNNTFIKWLIDKEQQMQEADRLHQENPQAHPSRRDRPYRIRNVELRDVRPAITTNDERGGSTGERFNESIFGRADGSTRGRDRPTSGRGEDAPEFGGGGRTLPGVGGTTPTRSTPERTAERDETTDPDAPKSIEDLLPSDPLADEDRSRDWRFEISWEVELMRPEMARQADLQPPPAAVRPVADSAPANTTEDPS